MFPHIRFQEQDPECIYRAEKIGEVLTGGALMCGGYTCPRLNTDYPVIQIYWVSESIRKSLTSICL